MKRIIVIILAVALMLCTASCGAKVQAVSNADSAPSMFVVVEQSARWMVVYQKDTGVMYAVSSGSMSGYDAVFTVLINADGTPMIYDGYTN